MDSPFLGMVQYFGFDWAPRGYAKCVGQLLSIQQNTALFALLGTYYGGDGIRTFGLPDLQGRAIVSQGANYSIGEKFGATSVTLLTTNMPSHTHTAAATLLANGTTANNVTTPAGNYPSSDPSGARSSDKQYAAPPTNGNLSSASVTIGNAGGSVPMSTQNPYLALGCCIATMGIFPSRN